MTGEDSSGKSCPPLSQDTEKEERNVEKMGRAGRSVDAEGHGACYRGCAVHTCNLTE